MGATARSPAMRSAALVLCLGGLTASSCLEDVSNQAPPGTVQCRVTADCKDPRAGLCDPAAYICRACRGPEDDARCKERDPATPVCGAGGVCAACSGAGEDATCAQADARRPSCVAGRCEACRGPADCQSGVCQPDGSCGDVSKVVFVDNRNGACDTTKAHAGTAQDPLCDVQAGVDRARAERKPFVRVAGSRTPYPPVTVNATSMADLLISGVPTGSDPVLIRGDAPALSVLGAATRVVVTAQGLELRSDDSHGVLCDQKMGTVMPELTLRASRIADSKGAGLLAIRCKLTVDGVRVVNNGQGGLRLSLSLSTLSNVMVHGNVRGPGVGLEGAMAGSVLRFATVGYNIYFGQPAGIDCGGQPFAVEHSIVVGNVGAASQFRGCKLTNVVVGSDTVMGGVQQTPEFVKTEEPLDLRLRPGEASRACCIDKVPMAPMGVALPERDVDGTRRPQGAAWDIGAHEVLQ